MTTTSRSDEHLLHVVFNGRVMGDIQRTARNRIRLRYDDKLDGAECDGPWFGEDDRTLV